MRKCNASILLAVLLAVAVGCAANRAAYVTIGATKIAVDTAVRAELDHVKAVGRCPAKTAPQPPGCVPYAKEKAVADALQKYKDTARTLGILLEATNSTPTPQQLSDAAEAVISLVEELTGKKVKR